MRLTISGRRVLQFLTVAFVVIMALNLTVIFLHFAAGIEGAIFEKALKKLYVDNEQNLPSYFNSLLFLVGSILTGLIHRLEKESTGLRFKWLLLSVVFLFLSLDESASVHEFFVTLPRHLGFGMQGIFRYTWIIVYGLGTVFLALYLVPSLLRLPKALFTGLMISGAVYLCGAVVFEVIGGQVASQEGTSNLRYALLATVEEALEMIGLLLFIHYLLVYIHLDFKSNSFTIT